MPEMIEVVGLPDADARPLVHPLDLPEARRPFLLGWLAGVVGPTVGLLMGAIAWFLSGSIVIGLIAGAPLVLAGGYIARTQDAAAWDFIPRRRQDRARSVPVVLDIVAGVVIGALILASTALIVQGPATGDLPDGVRQFAVGSALAVAAIVAIDVAASLLLGRGSYARRPGLAIPLIFAVVASAVVVALGLLPPDGLKMTMPMLLGALTVAVVGIVTLGWATARGHPRGTGD